MAQQTLSPSSTPASITPGSSTDGLTYAASVPLTATEASLFGGTGAVNPDPIGVEYGQAIVAVVQLTINGLILGGNTTYVVMQTDMGDGVWVDVAWCVTTFRQGTVTFLLCGGGVGAMNNAFAVSRDAGQPPSPQSSGSNAMPLGGRVRFVGKSSFTGGSSSLAGVTTSVSATIKYKILSPR